MAAVARNHHFIPEFFLSNFTASGRRDDFLWVTDMKARKGYRAKPCNAGFQKDFYRVDVKGARPDIVERILGLFEGYAAPAVRHVLEQHTLPARPELDHLIELIGLLLIKVPRARRIVNRAIDQAMKAELRPYFKDANTLRATFEKMRQDGEDLTHESDYEKLVHLAKNENLTTISVNKEWLLVEMFPTSVLVQRMLFERNWTILLAVDGAGEFICSDSPVCLIWTDPHRQDRAPALHEHRTDVTVPLGKRVALRGRYEPDQPALLPCGRKAISHVNICTISPADRFLYSSIKDFWWEQNDGSIGDWDDLMGDS
jgi:hypothetical protein